MTFQSLTSDCSNSTTHIDSTLLEEVGDYWRCFPIENQSWMSRLDEPNCKSELIKRLLTLWWLTEFVFVFFPVLSLKSFKLQVVSCAFLIPVVAFLIDIEVALRHWRTKWSELLTTKIRITCLITQTSGIENSRSFVRTSSITSVNEAFTIVPLELVGSPGLV